MIAKNKTKTRKRGIIKKSTITREQMKIIQGIQMLFNEGLITPEQAKRSLIKL